MRQALVLMVFMAVLGCSNGSDPIRIPVDQDCSVTSTGQNRFGYLVCANAQAQIFECPDFCPGVAPVCVTRCTDGHLSAAPDWTCPCSGDPCWRVVQTALQECPGCGDGVREDAEECDTTDFGGATCVSLGCAGGTPTCTLTCTINKINCTGCP